MVPQRVEAPAASACAGAERQGKTQPTEQQNPKLRADDSDIVGGGEDSKHTAGVWAGLREQQGTRRWRKVSKMRLERALITGSASPALPATQVVNPGAIFDGPVRRKSGVGKGGVPGRSTEALVDEVSCSLGRCCDDWHTAGLWVSEQGEEPRRSCRRTVSEHWQSVKPGSPIRSLPVERGRSQAEPATLKWQTGAAGRSFRQRGVRKAEQGKQAPVNCAIVRRSKGQSGSRRQHAEEVVGPRASAKA